MSKILIYNIAAEKGGALTILNNFYEKAKLDKKNEYLFVISKTNLKDRSNIILKEVSWVKKSMIHRIFFELVMANRIVIQWRPDEIISLQNHVILFSKKKHTIYLHQAIPFYSYKYSIIKEPKYWFYKNIYSQLVRYSLKKSENIIVQSNWLKDILIKDEGIVSDKIIVDPPEINLEPFLSQNNTLSEDKITFFYPTSAEHYKNYVVIFRALSNISDKVNPNHYEVVLTLSPDQNKTLSNFQKEAQNRNIPIRFVGYLNKQEMIDCYLKSTLIFTSKIETFGLPLLEAAYLKRPIITVDLPYAKEAIKNYDVVKFIDADDDKALAEIMLNLIKSHIKEVIEKST